MRSAGTIVGTFVVVGSLVGALGCDRTDATGARDAAPDEAAEARAVDPYGATVPELRAALEVARARAEEARGTGEEARAVRGAAELLRALSLRESDGMLLLEARRLLEGVAARSDVGGACDAALDLARLEARDAGDLEAAHAVAARALRDFGEVSGAERCVAEVRRLSTILAPYGGAPGGRDGAGAEVASAGADVSAWALETGNEGAAGATLAEMAVYGGGALGGDAPSVVRAALRFDRVALFRRGEVPGDGVVPRRVFLDFAGVSAAPSVPEVLPVSAAGLLRVRRGSPEPGVTRVVFDLEESARYRLFFLTDPYRVLLDVERAGRGGEGAVASAAAPVRVVVIDPGHGGDDFGARYDGLRESRLVLDISRRAAAMVERAMPGTRVLLTRQTDEIVSLEERTAMANAVGADVFVSVHLNAADEPVETGGVTTFLLDTSNTRQALRLAARENGTSTREVTGLQRILADLHREGQVQRSRRLAERVQTATLAAGRAVLPSLPDRGVRSAMFYVLVGARMPAVLVEASFMTKPEEAAALRSDVYRHALATGIAEGVVRYARGD